MRYILWVVGLLDACDVTNNGRHPGFYQELEIRLKPREILRLELYMISNTLISTLHDFSLKIYFYCWKKVEKTCIFTQNWLDHLLPITSYPVTIAIEYHWKLLNLFQNLREGWKNSYWKRQVLMLYPLGKNSEKPYGGVASIPSPPPPPPTHLLYVWGLTRTGWSTI